MVSKIHLAVVHMKNIDVDENVTEILIPITKT